MRYLILACLLLSACATAERSAYVDRDRYDRGHSESEAEPPFKGAQQK